MKVKRFDEHKSEAENKDWVDLKVLARETRGYVGADLQGLVMSAAKYYLERASPMLVDFEESDVTEEFLTAMEVTMQDFRKAMSEMSPSALKDVQIEVRFAGVSLPCHLPVSPLCPPNDLNQPDANGELRRHWWAG